MGTASGDASPRACGRWPPSPRFPAELGLARAAGTGEVPSLHLRGSQRGPRRPRGRQGPGPEQQRHEATPGPQPQRLGHVRQRQPRPGSGWDVTTSRRPTRGGSRRAGACAGPLEIDQRQAHEGLLEALENGGASVCASASKDSPESVFRMRRAQFSRASCPCSQAAPPVGAARSAAPRRVRRARGRAASSYPRQRR